MPRELKAVPEGKGPVSQENPSDILNGLRGYTEYIYIYMIYTV